MIAAYTSSNPSLTVATDALTGHMTVNAPLVALAPIRLEFGGVGS
jgi:hypothetical protein